MSACLMVVSACLMVVSACLWWYLHVWCWHLPACGGVCQVSACLTVVSAWYLPVQWCRLPVWWQCLSNVGDYLPFWSWHLPGILPVWLQCLPGSCLSDGGVCLIAACLMVVSFWFQVHWHGVWRAWRDRQTPQRRPRPRMPSNRSVTTT